MNETFFESGEAHKFSYQSLQAATNNFSNRNLIGKDGDGELYRGVLPNGTFIAVAPDCTPESIELLSRTRHLNIARVIGYCFCKNQSILVYEHFRKDSLYDLLTSKEKRESLLIWPTRAAVCNGIARGLHHLHEETIPCVIHRDIKPANIRFDINFTPKIIGFGFVCEEEECNEVIGTYGYADPEYIKTGKCTLKSDVYGFGVVMLEIMSGRKALEGKIHLSEWALDLLANDRVWEVVDPVLADFPVDQVLGFMDVAFSCLEKESRLRPSMGEVIQMLNRVSNFTRPSFKMKQPNTPYFSAASSFRSSISQTYDEIDGESSISDGKSSMESEETTKLQTQEEKADEATETSATHSTATNIAQQQDT